MVNVMKVICDNKFWDLLFLSALGLTAAIVITVVKRNHPSIDDLNDNVDNNN